MSSGGERLNILYLELQPGQEGLARLELLDDIEVVRCDADELATRVH